MIFGLPKLPLLLFLDVGLRLYDTLAEAVKSQVDSICESTVTHAKRPYLLNERNSHVPGVARRTRLTH